MSGNRLICVKQFTVRDCGNIPVEYWTKVGEEYTVASAFNVNVDFRNHFYAFPGLYYTLWEMPSFYAYHSEFFATIADEPEQELEDSIVETSAVTG